MNGLFVRALFAFLALPGVVAIAVPLLLFERTWPPTGVAWIGAGVCAIGFAVLALTVRDFYVFGRGTLAPWAPPSQLVTAGLYRYSRNPMYVGVLCLVSGWALLFRSAPLALYAASLLVVFHLRVLWGEEPWLARTHGAAWRAYATRVPRWGGVRADARAARGVRGDRTRRRGRHRIGRWSCGHDVRPDSQRGPWRTGGGSGRSPVDSYSVFSPSRLQRRVMAVLIVLVAATLLARLAGHLGMPALRDWAAATRVGLAVMFCFTAVAHFNTMRADLIAMVPPLVPNPEFMVTFTGVCEVLGAIGLLVPRTRRIAGVALILFLLAVLPANIHAAQAGVSLGGAPVTPIVPRVALQALFIALLWWSAVRPSRPRR